MLFMCHREEIDLKKLIKRNGEFVFLAIAEGMPKEKQEIEATREILEGLYSTWLKLAEYEDLGMTADEIRYFMKDFGISQAIEIRELKKKQEEDKEIISKMAERIRKFEEKLLRD